MSATHVAYWELTPTIDHVQPVSRGGADDLANWVCCSMLTNGVKANWTLEQLGWELLPPGDFHEWDGLLNWFVRQMNHHKSRRWSAYFRRWYAAAEPYTS